MKNQTILFVAVCVICLLFYRCSNSIQMAVATNDYSSNLIISAGYASQAE
jgi:hypothetical protein